MLNFGVKSELWKESKDFRRLSERSGHHLQRSCTGKAIIKEKDRLQGGRARLNFDGKAARCYIFASDKTKVFGWNSLSESVTKFVLQFSLSNICNKRNIFRKSHVLQRATFLCMWWRVFAVSLKILAGLLTYVRYL